jgi:hypothetical protein
MNEHEAYQELMRRVEASRTTGCAETDDYDDSAAHGVVIGVAIGALIWGLAILFWEMFW